MASSSTFRLAGVMGSPIAHSRSPVIHNYWLQQAGLTGTYMPLDVRPEALERALRALPALGFSGCNLTIPHKVLALSLVDEIDPVARRVGAGNCCVVEENGRLRLHNFDVYGFVTNLREAHPDWQASAAPALILGAGGAARAAIVGLLDEGVPEIRITNRTQSSAEALADEFGARLTVVPWEKRHEATAGVGLLVNTTSLGMSGQPALDMRLDDLPRTALVNDIVYVPLETGLLRAARQRGNRIVDGLGMLLHQARPAFRAWWGVLPQVTPELRKRIEETL